jgi:hypothetical protein
VAAYTVCLALSGAFKLYAFFLTGRTGRWGELRVFLSLFNIVFYSIAILATTVQMGRVKREERVRLQQEKLLAID